MSQRILAAEQTQGLGRPEHPVYLPEVQGLRALAVLMVVTYHVWLGRVSGGVDIFLLVSAFLLTLSFIRKVEAGKALDLGSYWLHLFKRLLPAVVVVLVTVLAATALFVPRSRWTEILSQTWSSLFYFQNWVLAAGSVDYYEPDQSIASPLQHFWSLSVQGQVFILWPLLFALAAAIARTAKLRFRRVLAVIFGSVFVLSLAFSVFETYTNQVHAYFDTRTRLWEFAFGTLLVLALPYLRLPRPLRIAAGWIGVAAMLSGGFVLDVQGQFPGYVALWPLMAAALVIVAGQTGSPFGADRLLSWKPLIRLGDMSYALYLWHWPALVLYLIWSDREEVGITGGTVIIAVSLSLAFLTTKFVERPIRTMRWAEGKNARTAVVVAVCVALVAVPVTGWQQLLGYQTRMAEAEAVVNNPGARILMSEYEDHRSADAPVLPLLAALDQDWASLDGDCKRFPEAPKDPLLKQHCMATATVDYEKTLLVLGDSHAQQWLGSIKPLAEQRNYRVFALLLGGCQFGAPGDQWDGCREFNEAALEYALQLKPDTVLTVGTAAQPAAAEDVIVAGLPEASLQLASKGVPVIGIRDNPRFTYNVVHCTEEHGFDSSKCSATLESKLSDGAAVASAFDALQGVALLDMTDFICPDGVCAPVIGNIRVYLDDNHLTSSYTASLSEEFERRFQDLVNW